MHVVDSSLPQRLHHDLELVVVDPLWHVLVPGEADSDGYRITDRGPGGVVALEQEAHAVLERAAVLVGPLVGAGRQELVLEVAVGRVDLEPVEARHHRQATGAPVLLDLGMDLLPGHLAGHVGSGREGGLGVEEPGELLGGVLDHHLGEHRRLGAVGDRGRGRGRLVVRIVSLTAEADRELDEDLGAEGVDRLGQLLESGEVGGVEEVEIGRVGETRGELGAEHALRDDQAGPTACACRVVGQVLIGHKAVVARGHQHVHGGHHDPVVDLAVPDLDGLEKLRMGDLGGVLLGHGVDLLSGPRLAPGAGFAEIRVI